MNCVLQEKLQVIMTIIKGHDNNLLNKEQDAWVLWHWDNNTGDEGVTNYKELEDTEEEIESEILDQQKYIANREIFMISITKKILWCFLFAKRVVVCKILYCDLLYTRRKANQGEG